MALASLRKPQHANPMAKRAALFDSIASRAGEHPRRVQQGFGGTQ